MKWVTLVIIFSAILLHTHGRRLVDKNKHADEEDETPMSRKAIAAPTLIFGNPEVVNSLTKDEGYSPSGNGKVPISLALYEEKTKEMVGADTDEAFVRNLIIKRIKRQAPQKDMDNESLEEEEEAIAKKKRKEQEDDEDDEEQKAKDSTTTTSKPVVVVTPQSGTTTVSSLSTSTTPTIPGRNATVTTSQKPPGQMSQLPPPMQMPSSGPPLNGTRRVVLPQGAALPPGAMFRPSGGPPPHMGSHNMGPPGVGGNRPPFPFPPNLLFGNLNLSVTPKPAKKGELYLPEHYNNLEIPKLDAGKLFGIKVSKLSPVPVLVFLNIRSVRDIDELSEEIVLDMDMKVEWVDGVLFDPLNALRSKPTKPTTLNPVFLKKIWQPDIYIDETVRVRKPELMAAPHTLLFSPGTGLVSYTFRVTVRLACEMNFFYYPADTHRCEFHLRSYSYFDVDLDLSWLRNGVFLQDPGDPNFDLEADDIQEIKIKQVFNEANNDTYDGLAFTVVARRKLSYHMVQTYLPSIFFIVITWLCFLVPARMVEARIGISMTTLLTLTAMFSSVRESTPIVSYVKAIDVWMVFCIFFVFLTLLEFSLLVWIRSFREDAEEKRLQHERELMSRRGSKEKGNRDPSPSRDSVKSVDLKAYEQFAEFTEKWAFLIFSVVFIFFNIWYWSWLLNASDYFNWSVNATHNGPLDE